MQLRGAVVTLVFVVLELPESVVVLTGRAISLNEGLDGQGPVGFLQVLEQLELASLGDRELVDLVGFPLVLIA